MNIPEELKTRLLNELGFIIEKIKTETDPKRKVYFLSAAHGAVERTMRYFSSGELYIVHFTLNVFFNTTNGLIGRISEGDTAILPPTDLWERIADNLNDLKNAIENDESTYPILEQISTIMYSLSGPGYYATNYLKSVEASNP